MEWRQHLDRVACIVQRVESCWNHLAAMRFIFCGLRKADAPGIPMTTRMDIALRFDGPTRKGLDLPGPLTSEFNFSLFPGAVGGANITQDENVPVF